MHTEVSIPGSVTEISFCKNSKILAVVVDHNKIYLWDTRTKTLINKLGPYSHAINSLSISEKLIAVYTSKSTVELLSLKTGYSIKTISTTSPIDCIALSPKNHVLAVTTNDQLQLWSIPARAHQSQPGSTVFIHPDNKYIVSSLQGKVFIYDSLLSKLAQKNTSTSIAMFHPQQNALIMNDDKQVVIWYLDKDEQKQTNIFGKFISCSPSGNTMAINYGDADIGFSGVDTNQDIGKIRLNANTKQQILVQFLNETTSVVATQNKCFVYDITQSQDMQTLLAKNDRATTFDSNIRSVKISNNDIFIATQNDIFQVDKALKIICTIATQQEISCFSIGRQNIVIAGANGTIHVWNRQQQQFTHNFNASYDKIDNLNLLNDYTLIVSVNNNITRWSISPTKTVVYTTKWQSSFQSKFRQKNQQWILETNLDFSPKTTARSVFGHSIADNLSTKQISAIKYIFP